MVLLQGTPWHRYNSKVKYIIMTRKPFEISKALKQPLLISPHDRCAKVTSFDLNIKSFWVASLSPNFTNELVAILLCFCSHLKGCQYKSHLDVPLCKMTCKCKVLRSKYQKLSSFVLVSRIHQPIRPLHRGLETTWPTCQHQLCAFNLH